VNYMRLARLASALAVAVASVLIAAGSGSAQTATGCTPGPVTWTLWAGQTIAAGTVTVENDSTNLYVTYTLTYPGATFGTLHMWAGNDLTNLPKNSQGVPVNGQFPYKTTSDPTYVPGGVEYTFTVTLDSLGIVDVAAACPLTLYVVTHAEVNIDTDDDGVADRHETAYGGDQNGNPDRGRWWYYGAYCLTCQFNPQTTFACNTAFAKGGYVFVTDKKSNPEGLKSLNLTRNRWGWAVNVTATGTTTHHVWAGAGLNKTSNGMLVGTATVAWDGNYATVTYSLTSPNVMEEVHIYAGDSAPTTTAPGQYGNTAYFDPKTSTYSTTLAASDTNGDGIWIIAHAVACYPVQ
jgi:hypothetical protein